jgi:hypothetical protein
VKAEQNRIGGHINLVHEAPTFIEEVQVRVNRYLSHPTAQCSGRQQIQQRLVFRLTPAAYVPYRRAAKSFRHENFGVTVINYVVPLRGIEPCVVVDGVEWDSSE